MLAQTMCFVLSMYKTKLVMLPHSTEGSPKAGGPTGDTQIDKDLCGPLTDSQIWPEGIMTD